MNNNDNMFCCLPSFCSSQLSNNNNTNATAMSNDLKDVVLHVYLLTDVIPAPYVQGGSQQPQQQQQQRTSRGSWFTRTFLPSIGLGAFHTSIQIYGYRYTFTGNYGVVKCFSHVELTGLPPNALYQQSIQLGRTSYERGQVNEIIEKLQTQYFKPSSYHMVHRNCNHFTETLATALILGGDDTLSDGSIDRLSTYPPWINRLANTGQCIIPTKVADGHGNDDDDDNMIRTCHPIDEARTAVGADRKVGWSLNSWKEKQEALSKELNKESSQAKKKELTDVQKTALAKIRNSSSNK